MFKVACSARHQTTTVSGNFFRLIVLCSLPVWFMSTAPAQSSSSHRQNDDSRLRDRNDQLQVESRLVDQVYCSTSNLRLRIQLTLTNTGNSSIILDKNYFSAGRSLIARDVASVKTRSKRQNLTAGSSIVRAQMVSATPDTSTSHSTIRRNWRSSTRA